MNFKQINLALIALGMVATTQSFAMEADDAGNPAVRVVAQPVAEVQPVVAQPAEPVVPVAAQPDQIDKLQRIRELLPRIEADLATLETGHQEIAAGLARIAARNREVLERIPQLLPIQAAPIAVQPAAQPAQSAPSIARLSDALTASGLTAEKQQAFIDRMIARVKAGRTEAPRGRAQKPQEAPKVIAKRTRKAPRIEARNTRKTVKEETRNAKRTLRKLKTATKQAQATEQKNVRKKGHPQRNRKARRARR